jgi:tetratricopeptide (TPR) repeat protein
MRENDSGGRQKDSEMDFQSGLEPAAEEIKLQLRRMLASKRFIANENSARFLTTVVLKALAGQPIKEDILGFELFPMKYAQKDVGRDIADVRVNANKLRHLLADYYADEGLDDPVRILLPTPPGRNEPKLPAGKAYTPVFSRNPRSAAQTHYLQGQSMLSQLRLGKAEKCFIEAIDAEPAHAGACLGLAETYLVFAMCLNVSEAQEVSQGEQWRSFAGIFPDVRSLIANALALNRTSWRAHVLRGAAHCYQRKWKKADDAFRTALAIDPEGTRNDLWYTAYLAATAKLDEAAAHLQAKIKSSPENVAAITQYGFLLYARREFHEAYRVFRTANNLNGHYWPARIGDVLVMLELKKLVPDMAGDAVSTILSLNDFKSDLSFPGISALCLALNGLDEEARWHLDAFSVLCVGHRDWPLERLKDTNSVPVALAYLAMGDKFEARMWLKRAFYNYSPLLLWMRLWPLFDSLRTDEEFHWLLTEMKFPGYK